MLEGGEKEPIDRSTLLKQRKEARKQAKVVEERAGEKYGSMI